MSHPTNTQLIEQKGEMFDEAVERGDYPTALSIARDFRDAGFGSGLLEALRNAPLEKFALKTPYDY